MSLMLINGNSLKIPLADESVDCVVTSPPYWGLRNYGTDDQLGLEKSPQQYVENMTNVFREVWRILRKDGTLWLNLGDSYNGSGGAGGDYNKGGLKEGQPRYPGRNSSMLKPKDLAGIPWRTALALQDDGWWLRSDIIWHKSNPMPEPVRDRPTKAHEYIFLLTKSAKYFYDIDAIREPHAMQKDMKRSIENEELKSIDIDTKASSLRQNGMATHRNSFGEVGYHIGGRNKRTVWTIPTRPYSGAHFAVFPPNLIKPCIMAGSSEHGCCSNCGTPYKRVVIRGNSEHHCRPGCTCQGKNQTEQNWTDGWQQYGNYKNTSITTNDWKPTCNCNTNKIAPSIIFDPFCGSGTTLQVARELGRNAIGLDISFPYLNDVAQDRLGINKQQQWKSGIETSNMPIDDMFSMYNK